MINREEEYTRMASVEKELWWYKILHNKTLHALKSNQVYPGDLLIDAGCGTGGLMSKLTEEGYKAIGIDVSAHAIQFCQNKKLNVHQIDLSQIDTLFPEGQAKAIISNDSFYFFAGREKMLLEKFRKVLTPKGLLILNYPALAAFGGIHDLSVGIKERIYKKKLVKILEENGFEISKAEYWPFFLSPFIFLVRSYQRIKLKMIKNVSINSDVSMPGKLINGLFYQLTKAEEKWPLKPWGSSLFIVARKK